MANLFRSVRRSKPKRNVFDLSHDVKLTTDFGRLTPVLFKEVVPGDTWRMKSEMLIRTAPLFAPLMHRVNAYVHYFFIPCRLLMDDWETFITGGENGDGKITERFAAQPTEILKPYVKFTSLVRWFSNANALANVIGQGSLWDYLGFPGQRGNDITAIAGSPGLAVEQMIDLLPFRAYQLVWNEYYRDQNFEDEVDIMSDVNGDWFSYLNQAIADGADGVAIGDMVSRFFMTHQRNWEKDYFTSSLPWPQRGDTTTIGEDERAIVNQEVYPDNYHSELIDGRVDVEDVMQHVISTVDIGAVSINELRRALAVQKFREKLARYGSRYTEFLRGLFGVNPKDSRLQRPEFLGGYKQQVQFGEVLQTSQTTDDSPQGTYAGTGFSLSGGKYIKRYFDEHGYILGILSIMPKPAYMQGLGREFTRFDKLDYFIPDFAHLGEQDVRTQELVWSMSQSAGNNAVFGYIPRYAEYKFAPSRVCGLMRTELDFWHLARRVQRGQALNSSFLNVSQAEMDRVFNFVGDSSSSQTAGPSRNDHFWLQVYHDIKAARPMPKFGTPLL